MPTTPTPPKGQPAPRPPHPKPPRRTLLHTLAIALTLGPAATSSALAAEPFVFLTDWYAQAEHGGFYQAQADGLYAKAGLDVKLKMGGPQVNGLQLLAAGQADCLMGYDVQTMQSWQQGLQVVTVAAFFQKSPTVLIGHPDVKKFEDLRTRTLLVGSAGMVTYWPWLKSRHGFSDAQMRPYTFNIQPFLASTSVAQQGYLGSEPYSIEKKAGFKPRVFLLADQGWPPYATTVVCTKQTLAKRPQAVKAFLKASAEGWQRYLAGNPAPADALIRRDNPNMTADLLAYGRQQLKAAGIVGGGDAATQGIGTLTEARMKATYDMLVKHQLLDPKKVNVADTYDRRFMQDIKVLP